ncbi:hypothetical protein D3C72_1994550 [compost metagenome]
MDVLARKRELSLSEPRAYRQAIAAFGDRDAPGAAREQRRVEFGFQFLDGLRHRGLTQVQAARGCPDAAKFSHFQPGP